MNLSNSHLSIIQLTETRFAFIESKGDKVKENEGYFIIVVSPCWHLVNTVVDNRVSHREI